MDAEALARVKATDGGIWLPGTGVTDPLQRSIGRALKEYDERLELGRHELTGDWCVFLSPRANPFDTGLPFPVLGIGATLTSVEEVMAKLRKYDAVRNGEKILEQMERDNQKIKEPFENAAAEASGIVAEGAESFLHDIGRTKYRRSLRPTKETGIRSH